MKSKNERRYLPIVLVAVTLVLGIAISTIILLKFSGKLPTRYAEGGKVMGVGGFSDPKGPWTAYEKAAKDAYRTNDVTTAIKDLGRAITVAEENKAPHTVKMFLRRQRGGIFVDIGNQEGFKKDCRVFVNLADKNNMVTASEDALIMLAQSEYDTGNFSQAEKDLDKLENSLIKTRSDTFAGLIRVYELKGRVYLKQNEPKKAEQMFLKSLDLSARVKSQGYIGSNGITYFYLSQIYKERGDYAEALKYIRLAEKAEKDIVYSNEKASFIDKQFMVLPVPMESKAINSLARGEKETESKAQ